MYWISIRSVVLLVRSKILGSDILYGNVGVGTESVVVG